MARNIYFSEQVRSEQSLYEDIVIEALKIYGYDMYYLPRDIINRDDLLNEDVSSRFNSSYMIEMYVDNIEGFDGQGDIFQKFGVEIRDNVTLTMSRRRWNQAIKRHDNELTSERPLEGDLVYVPFSRKLFQIMRVEHEQPFYQINNLPTYKLYCELYEFAGDDFDTGVAIVDEIERSYAYKYILSFTSGDNATATAALASSGNHVASITVTNGGSGYTSAPIVEFSKPTAVPTTAQATAISDGFSVTDVNLIDSGMYYLRAPIVGSISPTPGARFKFGNNSLYHDSANAQYAFSGSHTTSPINNRLVYRWFYWAESSGQPYNALLNQGDGWQIYHRSSDNKIVYQDSSVEFENPASIIVYDSDADSGFWNYIEFHMLNQQAKLHVNSVDMSPVTISYLNYDDTSRATVLGKPNRTLGISLLKDSVTQSFKGYMDHYAFISSGDNEFRDADPIPTTAAIANRDGDTLVLATVLSTFDYVPAVFTAQVSNGRVDQILISDPGTNITNASNALTISAPTGTANNFVPRATAILNNGSVVALDLVIDSTASVGGLPLNSLFAGAGYEGTAPTIKIKPQGGDVLFEPGDKVYQTLSTGVVLEGEVAQFSDSDYKVHVINVQTSDGLYHDFTTNVRLNKDSVNGPGAFVITIEEINQLSENEQNDQFDTEADAFLDFSETNPFGDPS